MKKIILSACILFAANSKAQVIVDTVSTGLNYTNQIWYSLAKDEVKTQPKDNWDLGIEITGFSASILVNTQKAGTAAYQTPYNRAQWSQFDTAGYTKWNALHNSDTSWGIGALNKVASGADEDLGWGTYDVNTHFISGSRLFLLVSGGKFLKLSIDSLKNSVYKITYMNIDGTDSTTFTVAKSAYKNKNFAYYDFATKSVIDREPSNIAWDLTFTKYIYNNYPLMGGGTMPYPVTGILQNKGVKIAEVTNVNDTIKDYAGRAFATRINEIGSDWKTFTGGTYVITDSLVYFVQDIDKNYWKVILKGFSGSTLGNYMFTKEKLKNLVSVASFNADNRVAIYPNPAASGNSVYMITDFKGDLGASNLVITDINGKVVFQNTNISLDGFGAIEIPFSFDKGVYFISVQTQQGTMTQKLLSY